MRHLARSFVASLKALMIAVLAGSASADARELTDDDDASWGLAKESGTAEAYQQYLRDFPSGRHIDDAVRGIVEGETLAARFKDKGEKGRPEAFGAPGKPDIGPPGQY